MKKHYDQNLRLQRGMTLLEVLIAALILGLGLMSVAAMQINALKVTSNAAFRIYATDTARTLADRMRANIPATGAALGAGNSEYIVDWDDAVCGAAANQCSTSKDDDAVECDSTRVAAWDLWELTCSPSIGMKTNLPSPRLTVTCLTPASTDECTISIRWDESIKQTKAGDPTTVEQNVQLTVTPGILKGI